MGKCVKYSIIVPIYNVDRFLKDCLDSIQNAMTDECECILINDGSTDNSGHIAEVYCETQAFFHYYKKENGGLSDARNFGLQFAKGEYILFVDSDDVISPIIIHAIDIALKKSNTDVVYFNFLKFYSGNVIKLLANDINGLQIRYSGRKELSQMPNFAWARVARRNLYTENKFPTGIIYEDVFTSPYISQQSTVVAFIDLPLYGYRKRSGSITTDSAEKQFKMFEAVKLLKARQEKGEVEFVFYSTALINLSQSCLVSLARIEDANTRRIYRKFIKNEFNALTFKNIMVSYSKIKFKCLAMASKITLSLYVLEKILRPVVLFADKRNH
ncbi:glycosyltransferase family 2 protein [Kosakonia pseudosacchari]|uniref:glycosyltransferase family 2 protein n=1 Tax=Kosakonia pseudosacchari TaxID=1646340 RepID=UPI001882F4F3|nr:glycosyltransferase [Kosakonia pseudosacchari]QOV62486.1 glycosyltransferase [Kosakonia pseudosacchari]